MAHEHMRPLYINMIRDALQVPSNFELIFSNDIFNISAEDRQYIFSNLTPNEVEQLFTILSEFTHEMKNVRYQNFMAKIISIYPHLNISRYITNLLMIHPHTFDLSVHIEIIMDNVIMQHEYIDIITDYYPLRLQLFDNWDVLIDNMLRALDIERKTEDINLEELTSIQLHDYLLKIDDISLMNIGKKYNMHIWFKHGMDQAPQSERLIDTYNEILEETTNVPALFKVATPNSWK